MSRALGDEGICMHMGEIYCCQIPSNQTSLLYMASDGPEEGMHITDIIEFVCDPKDALERVFLKNHEFVKMYGTYKPWFNSKDVYDFPKNETLDRKLDWFNNCLRNAGETILGNSLNIDLQIEIMQ